MSQLCTAIGCPSRRRLEARVSELEAELAEWRARDAGVAAEAEAMAPALKLRRLYGLTLRQAQLLLILLRHPGQDLSRARVIASVWGQDGEISDRCVDVTMMRVRRGLMSVDPHALIETVHGYGWRLDGATAARIAVKLKAAA